MEWITDNWVWLLLFGGMFGMHFFGHGRHGAGGGGGCCGGGHAHGQDKAAKADASVTQGKLPASGEGDAVS